MLNVAKGIYSHPVLPIPMVKQVAILPVEMEQEELKQLSLEVTVVLQVPADQNKYEDTPFNLNVTALMDVSKIPRYTHKAALRGLARADNEVITNVRIDNLTKGVSKTYYNENTSSKLISKTVVVPIILTTTQPVTNLTLIVFTNEISVQTEGETPTSPTMEELPFSVSDPVFEDVMREGTPLRMSNVFKLLDTVDGFGSAGEIWPGAVHISGSTLMVGPHHSAADHPRVELLPTLNQKIKDYREIEARNLIPTVSRASNRENYLSDALYSRSDNGLLNLYFSFDLMGYIKNMGAFSHMITNGTVLLETMAINEIKVYRSKVNADDLSNVLTPALRDCLESCQDIEKELVARLSNGSVQLIQSRTTNSARTCVQIVATDSVVPLELENYFNYEVVIEMVDNGAAAIKTVVENLDDGMASFKSYLNRFMNEGKSGYNIEAYQLSAQKSLKGDNSWKALLNDFLAALSFLRGPSEQLETIAREMITFGSPNSADQRSLMTFQKVIGDFLGRLRSSLTPPTVGKSSSKPAFGSKISTASASSRRLKYVSSLKNKYHNKFGEKTGVRYIPASAPSKGTLPSVSFESYQKRISHEVARYDVRSPTAPSINRYGFLSPMHISANTSNFPAGREMEFKQSLDLLQASLSPGATSTAYSYIGNPNIPTVAKTDINNLLTLNGVSYDINCEEKTQLQEVYDAIPGSPISTDASRYLSTGSVFVKDDEYLQAAMSGSEKLPYRSFTDAPDRMLDSDVIQILLEKSADNYRTPSPVNLPNIRGSLPFAELSGSTEAFNAMNPLEQNINFNAVSRIEFLRAVGSEGRHLWTPLTPISFTKAMEAGAALLCRINGPVQVLDIPNPFDLGSYDSVFVIGPSIPTRQASESPDALFTMTKNHTQSLLSLSSLNYKGAGSAVLTQYLCSPSAIRLTSDQRSEALKAARMRNGNRSAQNTTGGGY